STWAGDRFSFLAIVSMRFVASFIKSPLDTGNCAAASADTRTRTAAKRMDRVKRIILCSLFLRLGLLDRSPAPRVYFAPRDLRQRVQPGRWLPIAPGRNYFASVLKEFQIAKAPVVAINAAPTEALAESITVSSPPPETSSSPDTK